MTEHFKILPPPLLSFLLLLFLIFFHNEAGSLSKALTGLKRSVNQAGLELLSAMSSSAVGCRRSLAGAAMPGSGLLQSMNSGRLRSQPFFLFTV